MSLSSRLLLIAFITASISSPLGRFGSRTEEPNAENRRTRCIKVGLGRTWGQDLTFLKTLS